MKNHSKKVSALFKNAFPVVLCFIFCMGGKGSFSQSLFSHSYGDTPSDAILTATFATDKKTLLCAGYALTGSKQDMMLSKVDTTGQLEWMSYVPSNSVKNSLLFTDILPLSNGNFLYIGTAIKSGHRSGLLVEVESDGHLKNKKTYRPTGNHLEGIHLYKGALLTGGKLAVIGQSHSRPGWTSALWAKFDSSGNTLSIKEMVKIKPESPVAIFHTSNDTTILFSSTGIFNINESIHPRVYKIDPQGNIVWVRNISTTVDVITTDCIQTGDGGYVLAGYSTTSAYLEKLNAEFHVLWAKTYDYTTSQLFTVAENNSGEIIAGGYSSPGGVKSNLIMKTDASGNLIEYKIITNNTLLDDIVYKVLPVSGSRIMWLGKHGSDAQIFNSSNDLNTACPATSPSVAENIFTSTIHNLEILFFDNITVEVLKPKLTPAATLITNEICPPVKGSNEPGQANSFQINISPNPAHDYLQIDLPEKDADLDYLFEVFDIMGKKKYAASVKEHSIMLQVSEWSAGLYIVRISLSGKIVSNSILDKQ